MTEAERVIQSKSSLQLFMHEHTSWGPSQVGRLLEHYWEHISPLASKQMSNRLLHCPSSPPFIVTPVLLKNCIKLCFFTHSHNEIMSRIVTNGRRASSSVKQQAANWRFWTRRPRLMGTLKFRKLLRLTKMEHAPTEPLSYKPQNTHRRCHLSRESRVWFEPQLRLRGRTFSVWPNSHRK